jgi:hypothetical protein
MVRVVDLVWVLVQGWRSWRKWVGEKRDSVNLLPLVVRRRVWIERSLGRGGRFAELTQGESSIVGKASMVDSCLWSIWEEYLEERRALYDWKMFKECSRSFV